MQFVEDGCQKNVYLLGLYSKCKAQRNVLDHLEDRSNMPPTDVLPVERDNAVQRL